MRLSASESHGPLRSRASQGAFVYLQPNGRMAYHCSPPSKHHEFPFGILSPVPNPVSIVRGGRHVAIVQASTGNRRGRRVKNVPEEVPR
jgi:hypothetical protein